MPNASSSIVWQIHLLSKVNKTTMIDESRFPEDILAEADEEKEKGDET